jgi:multidrug resistance efflux pump
MENLPPIPSPLPRRWREFRINAVPPMIFVALVGVVAITWRHYVATPSVIGEVENAKVNVISTVPGTLAELNVDRFQKVSKDQIIGRVYTLEPEQLKASLAAIEVDLKVLKARMDLDKTRNANSLAQLRVDLGLEKLNLESARIQLVHAESEYARAKKLYDSQLIGLGASAARNDLGYEVALRDRDRLRAEVATRQQTIVELEKGIASLSASGVAESSPEDPLIDQAIKAQESKLVLLEGPVLLKAPIAGVVGILNHRPGEKIMAGDPIITISPEHSDRIVGYIRQPLTSIPKVGSSVKVRTRGPGRQTAIARVLEIGSDLQPVTAPLRIRGYDTSQERGLPFFVEMPAGLALHPGELVDLILLQ